MSNVIARGTYFSHPSGTKDYALFRIYNETTDKAVVVKCWGKVGATSQVQVLQASGIKHMDVLFSKELKSRKTKDYKEEITVHGQGGNLDAVIGKYKRELGGKHAPAVLVRMAATLANERVANEFSRLAVTSLDGVAPMTTAEPKPEPDRGVTWGTW